MRETLTSIPSSDTIHLYLCSQELVHALPHTIFSLLCVFSVTFFFLPNLD